MLLYLQASLVWKKGPCVTLISQISKGEVLYKVFYDGIR